VAVIRARGFRLVPDRWLTLSPGLTTWSRVPPGVRENPEISTAFPEDALSPRAAARGKTTPVNRSNRYFSAEPHLIRRWNGLALLVVPAERRVSHVPVGTLASVLWRFPGIEVFDIRGNRLGRFPPEASASAEGDADDA